jgi:glyoxylase-like metal-dependent hydrolase (beta-lactamase superfamily II)
MRRDPDRPTRADFLRRAGTSVVGAAAVLAAGAPAAAADEAAPRRGKGEADSNVRRWDVITVGNLSRNHYWGEAADKVYRPVICTCTLLQGEGFRLLADASLADAAQMARELDRRTGVRPRDVTAVFVTHEHGDHFAGIASFPDARWLASPAVAEILNRGGKLAKKIEGVTGRLFDAVDVMPTPGHTAGHASLRFDCDGLSVIVAGDAVATRDFFRDRRPYYNAVDVQQSKKTMDAMAAVGDVIVPGHDNYFLS